MNSPRAGFTGPELARALAFREFVERGGKPPKSRRRERELWTYSPRFRIYFLPDSMKRFVPHHPIRHDYEGKQ